jgi:hypothetical protein
LKTFAKYNSINEIFRKTLLPEEDSGIGKAGVV